jgi:hypothetical protein
VFKDAEISYGITACMSVWDFTPAHLPEAIFFLLALQPIVGMYFAAL